MFIAFFSSSKQIKSSVMTAALKYLAHMICSDDREAAVDKLIALKSLNLISFLQPYILSTVLIEGDGVVTNNE